MGNKNIKLVLEDGSTYRGCSFAAVRDVSGEVVFNTGMVGYPESLSDPSYKGQILVLTYPLIGNYGIPSYERDEHGILKFFESEKIQVQALVVSEYCKEPYHRTIETTLSDWLVKNGIPAVCGIDTRAITKKIREQGTMLGKIVFNKEIGFDDPNKQNLAREVSIKSPVAYGEGDITIAALDCGIKMNILRCFLKRGVKIILFPFDFDIFNDQFDFDALFISNGPGDPKTYRETIQIVRRAMAKNIPVFGICLGNQILALAAGADTYKLKYGHRSQNQPCRELGTHKCYITSQNHGYAIDTQTLPRGWLPWFENANDRTNEGIKHTLKPWFAVQFHPEASGGPTDSEFLFDKFIDAVKNEKN